MQLNIYQVDAFTSKVFSGNPAAVCPLEEWLEPEMMQQIAAENNLSETAFFVLREKGHYKIRWFMPNDEIDLCGHATLASAHVIFKYLDTDLEEITFHSQSGILKASRSEENRITLNFPSRLPIPTDIPEVVYEAFNYKPTAAFKSRDLVLLFDTEEQIQNMTYDLNPLKGLPYVCVTVTAPGETADFVSRVFDANGPIGEDPVTGSAHCNLIPFWSEKLGKNNLFARQLSPRGGELFCQDLGERVLITGEAVTYMKGEIWVQ